jgi:hypothetical protein
MTTAVQLPLIAGIPPVAVDDAKRQALKQVNQNADPYWKAFAYNCVVAVAKEKLEFTSDDVDAKIASAPTPQRPHTYEKRALGPVMLKACKNNIMASTDRLKVSCRSKLHNSPRRVWKSLTFEGVEPVAISERVQ